MVFTFLVYVAVNGSNVSHRFSFVNTNKQVFLIFFLLEGAALPF